MPGPKPDKMIAILKDQCALVPERVDSYRRELMEALADIVHAERDHQIRSTDIQKQVSAYCERLGDFVGGTETRKPGTERKRK